MLFSLTTVYRVVLVILLTGAVSGCTVKATLKSTSDAISNVLSSTTGRSWFTDDGFVRKGEEALAFASMNFENLQHDMAQGRGEYLESFASLISIKPERLKEFTSLTQSQYSSLMVAPNTTPVDFMSNLYQELERTAALNPTKTAL